MLRQLCDHVSDLLVPRLRLRDPQRAAVSVGRLHPRQARQRGRLRGAGLHPVLPLGDAPALGHCDHPVCGDIVPSLRQQEHIDGCPQVGVHVCVGGGGGRVVDYSHFDFDTFTTHISHPHPLTHPSIHSTIITDRWTDFSDRNASFLFQLMASMAGRK